MKRIMKTITSLRTCLLAVALPLAALAQPAPTADTATSADPYLRMQGDREFSIGGSGASNKDFDSTLGGVSFSYGQYLNNTVAVVLRQSVNYSNPDVGGTQWNGSTRVAVDKYILPRGRVRPFVGANFGGIYGDRVNDSWAAGLETGAKFYVQERTFIMAMVEYSWLFENSRGLDDRFDDGQFNWTVGVGFNF